MAPFERIFARDIDKAREEILDHMRRRRDKKIFYFYGWQGLGEIPVLRSIAQELGSIRAKKTPPELCFDRIIYIDCSAWESRRVMQRKIAEELELDLGTMAMFDKQDEEDDFDGVDHGSRDVIRSVSEAIAQTLVYKKLIMLFINGSDHEVDLNKFGISPDSWDHVILWTFRIRPLTIHGSTDLWAKPGGTDRIREIIQELRYTDLILFSQRWIADLTSSEFCVLLRQEAAIIVARHPSMPDMDITMVTECCLYELFLQHSFHRATGLHWEAHAPSYWMCDGIIKGDDGTRDISDTLHQEIHWKIDDASHLGTMFRKLIEDPEVPFLVVKDGTPLSMKRPYRWISVTSDNLEILNENINEALLERVSSLFVALGKSNDPQIFPYGFLKHCIKLGVLILSRCAFSFVSPPFIWCHGLRFLGLDHCTHDNNTSEGENNNTSWTWLQTLWVLDLRYTEWDDILSDEKLHNLDRLRELNIEGFMCWQLAARLQGKLHYLRRLRIMKPMHRADTSVGSSSSLVLDKTDLEVLDLSANRDMKNLSISSAMARSLQMLILDGCDGLENVVVPDGLPSSLRSFSFDGYGPATHWMQSLKLPPKSSKQKHNSNADTSAAKTSKISLQGCTQLESFFVRELPNLEELDLSGSEIKVLDFETMLRNVPGLKRLILLGCEHLRAIKWGSTRDSVRQLELLCVDTRPWRAAHVGPTRPCLAQHKSFTLQLHATLTDARLARSLYRLLDHCVFERVCRDFYFNIHATSSSVKYGGFVQVENPHEEMTEPNSQRQHHHHHVVEVIPLYSDAFSKIGVAPMLFFPRPPTQPLDHHIEISDESCGLEGELKRFGIAGLATMMDMYAESLYVHDAWTSSSIPGGGWSDLKWCRLERCPNLGTVFPAKVWGDVKQLQTIWASHLLMARCICSKGFDRHPDSFTNLQRLHLRSCPRFRFVLPVWVRSFPSLETLHIIHCGDLTHVFVLDGSYPKEIYVRGGLPFPKLTTIHLHDLPKLQQICEVKMLAPALETIKIRGCFALRRLPTVAAREPGVKKKPAVEMEKDVWESLEWDGLDAGHHPDLFQPPMHSRYYRRSRLLRGSMLR